ncbi:MAG: hypothetical protein P8182_06060 [Deltaproteobacteria bacterium]
MIGTNVQTGESSLLEKGRELLERGDIFSALECYKQVFDPESVDELEARTMLIEARSHLSRKHMLEALESFEEALMMGTERQRGQALEGLSAVGEIRSRLPGLTQELKKGLRKCFGKRKAASKGLELISDEENIVIISPEGIDRLPAKLMRSGKIQKLPPHLMDYPLPFYAEHCIPYVGAEDVRYILEVADHLISDETRSAVD